MPVQPSMGEKSWPADSAETTKHRRMSTRQRLLFFLTAWLIVLMPFLFWWNTWFGRQLSNQQIAEYLGDEKHPRHIQHALVQIGDRMARRDASVSRWYAELPRLSAHPVEEVRKDRKSTRLNSSHVKISYAVFCLKKKKKKKTKYKQKQKTIT